MNLGQQLLLKVEGILRKGTVEKIHQEDIDIRLLTGELIQKKFWEVKKINNEEIEKYKNLP